MHLRGGRFPTTAFSFWEGFCHRPPCSGQFSATEHILRGSISTTGPEGEGEILTRFLEVVYRSMIQRYPVIPVYGLRVPTLPRLTPARRRFA